MQRLAWYLLLIGSLIPATYMLGCKNASAPKSPEQKPEAAEPAPSSAQIATQVERPAPAESMWEDRCSFCHSQEELHGKNADDIRRAMTTIVAMRRLAQILSAQEVELMGKFLAGEPMTETYKYITPEACETCHASHVSAWRHSLHALAHREPVYDYYFIKASRETAQKIETFCASCHTPIGVLNGSIPFRKPVETPKDTKVSEVEASGVQCDFCHVIEGVKETKNAAYVVKPSRVKFGPYADSVSTFHDARYSELHKSAELCGSCHNVAHPANGIVLEDTYTEWKQGPYAKEGVVCQDCHMTKGLTRRLIQPGKASPLGPDRAHVSSHFFVGPNLLYADRAGAEELKRLSEKLLRSAAQLRIGDPELTPEGVFIPVMVTNVGAGHYLPSGVTEVRELWLQVIVTSATGKEVHRSGVLDQDGNVIPHSVMYFTEVAGTNGLPTTLFWNTTRKVSDRRIPPRETVTEKFLAPGMKPGDSLKVEVALQYRPVSPRGLAEVDAPKGIISTTPFTMARAEKTIELK